MSYGIHPFAVKLIHVERAFGSRDAALVAEIGEKFEYRFDEDDCDEDDEDEPTLEVALHEIVEGRPLRDDYGHKYGTILELLCDHFGTFLTNENFSGMHYDWIEEVDRGLIRAGVPDEAFGLGRHLIYRGSPVALPSSGDFPFIGYLKADEIGQVLQALGSADLTSLDPEVGNAVTELKGWLEACSKSARDLVCFYH